jgi:nucleotide-binding universal stress UspA family protein
MAVVLRTQIREHRGPPVETLSWGRGPELNVHVVFTNLDGAKTAFRLAGKLARDLGARVTVLVAQVVPYPLPLERPPVAVEFTEQALLRMVSEEEVETAIEVRLCRDSEETIREALVPESVVVMGGRRRWWLIREWMLAWRLRRDGHHVIYADSSDII